MADPIIADAVDDVADAGAASKKSSRSKSPTAHIYSKEAGARPLSGFLKFAAIPTFAFLVVVVLPFLVGVVLSFTNWNGIDSVTSGDYEYTGIENYSDALGDEAFRATMTRTFVYVLGVVVFSNLIAFGLALLVTSKLRAQNFFRAVFFTPNLIGGVILGFIWVFVFRQMFTWVGESTGIGFLEQSWLVDEKKGLAALVIVTVWQLSGYLMLIYIAGLVSISSDVIEASTVDGAKPWQQLFYVKLPLIVPSITVGVFLALRNAFLAFDVNLTLTNGGPFRSTELLPLNIFLEAFRFQNFETGQAKAVILFLIIAVIAVIQVAVSRRFEHSE
ncbi:carbohydrate ABC transporter permease [Ilumatobacter coccineus]|uniref:carbohydrate ABC transporter permease n=1 Tax=Ilumatobacter coccineus TaxID=467094 RepID=UPI00034A1989|nr:sugar ABC transporter permease [Ilumatobacter coccineus]